MFTPKDALLLILLPLLLSAGGAAATLFLRPRKHPTWPLILALTLAPFIAGLIAFPPTGTPKEAFDWVILLPALALIAALLSEFIPRGVGLTLMLIAAYISKSLILMHLAPGTVSTTASSLAFFIPTLLYFAFFELSKRPSAAALPSLFLLVATATTIVEFAGSAIQFSQYTIILPATLGPLLLLQLIFRNPTLSKGTLTAIILLWTSILTYGYFWADVPASRTLLLAAAPLTLWLVELFPKSLSPIKRTFIALTLTAIPLAFALYPALQELLKLLHDQQQGGY